MEELKAFFNQFVKLTEDSWQYVISNINEQAFSKGDLLQAQDTICRHIYFVRSGIIRVYHIDENGKEITTRFTFPGQVITSYYSTISGEPTNENIQAISEGTAYLISYEEIQRLFDQFREIERLARLILEDYFIKSEGRIIDLQTLSAQERYDKLVKLHPEILQKVPLGYIASYLGITQETLSRIRKKRI